MANRTPRELDTRDTAARAEYVPPSALPNPTPEDGYEFRWVATQVLGQPDPSNASKRFREGWEPVRAADHPELAIAASVGGNIEMGGLILCKAPKEMVEARERYYAKQASDQIKSVNEHYMRNNNPKMPLFTENKSDVSTGVQRFGDGNK